MSTTMENPVQKTRSKRGKIVPTTVFGEFYADVIDSIGETDNEGHQLGTKEHLFRTLAEAGYEVKHQSLGSKLQALASQLFPTNEYETDDNGVTKMKATSVDVLPKLADHGEGKGRKIDNKAVDKLRDRFAKFRPATV